MNKLTLIILALSLPVLAFSNEKPYGRVVEVKGTSFLSYKGKTKEVKSGDIIYPNSEIFVEATGQVSFTDNADHRFHLSSSSSVSLKYEEIELRSGNIWVQSINPSAVYELTSANAKVHYSAGEAVFSYDSLKGKSQLLVINGIMKFANLRQGELNLHVAEGHFSFIDPEFESGNPRTPTAVGNKSFNQMISNYVGIETLDKKSMELFRNNDQMMSEVGSTKESITSRGIASIDEVPAPKQKRVKAKSTKVVSKVNKVEINIYGLKDTTNIPSTAMYDLKKAQTIHKRTRMPASATPVEAIEDTVNALEDENPIIQHYKESDTLLERLKGL